MNKVDECRSLEGKINEVLSCNTEEAKDRLMLLIEQEKKQAVRDAVEEISLAFDISSDCNRMCMGRRHINSILKESEG